MTWDIDYNTSNKELMFPEYGRTVQDLLLKANDVAEDDDRQRYVERVIKLMLQMQPSVKQQENYQERLWKHAFKIAGGHLNVTVPEGIDASPDAERVAEKLKYPNVSKKRLVYGNNILALIEKGKEMEDGPERDHLIYTTAYYMKVALTSWRDGKFYNESLLRKNLKELSDGKLELPENAQIGEPGPNQPSQDDGTGKRKKKKNKNKSRSNNSGNNNNNNNRSSRSRGRNRRR